MSDFYEPTVFKREIQFSVLPAAERRKQNGDALHLFMSWTAVLTTAAMSVSPSLVYFPPRSLETRLAVVPAVISETHLSEVPQITDDLRTKAIRAKSLFSVLPPEPDGDEDPDYGF